MGIFPLIWNNWSLWGQPIEKGRGVGPVLASISCLQDNVHRTHIKDDKAPWSDSRPLATYHLRLVRVYYHSDSIEWCIYQPYQDVTGLCMHTHYAWYFLHALYQFAYSLTFILSHIPPLGFCMPMCSLQSDAFVQSSERNHQVKYIKVSIIIRREPLS